MCNPRLLFAPLLVGAVALSASGEATAAPPKGPPQADPFENGGFIYLSPGPGALPVGGASATQAKNSLDFSYQYGLGGGYMIRSAKTPIMMTVGGRFEHMIHNLDWNDDSHVDASGMAFRILPEVRIGAGLDWVFVYATLQPGFVLSTWKAEASGAVGCVQLANNLEYDDDTDFHSAGCDYEATRPGFNFGTGPGAMFRIYDGLVIGGEVGFDMAIFDDVYEPWEQMFTIDFQFMVGWFF